MDVSRTSGPLGRHLRRAGYAAAAVALMGGATLAATRLKPSAPVADASAIWSDIVRRGPLVRQIRGDGSLVPEDLRWIASGSSGRVERVLATPGTHVHADTEILELSNPQLEQDARDAVLRVQGAEAALANLRAQIVSDTLQQRGVLA